MKIVCLCGSPKATGSASAYVLKSLTAMLPNADVKDFSALPGKIQGLLPAILECDALVIAFPLYVDGIPGQLLRILSRELQPALAKSGCKAKVYAVINSGFYEARQNKIAMEMLQIWTEKSGLQWGQGLGIGGGGMLQATPMGRGPSVNAAGGLKLLSKNILEGKGGESMFIEPNFPRVLYKTMAHIGWVMQGKKYGNTRKDLYKRHGAKQQ